MGPSRSRRSITAATMAAPMVVALGVVAPADTVGDDVPAGFGGLLRYEITELDGADGAGNGINNRAWIGGQTTDPGTGKMRATLWRNGAVQSLGALGGDDANSAILWPNKSVNGMLAGVTETDDVDERNEFWSCAAFFGEDTDKACVGFVWEDGEMRALPTHGGTHGFAAGVNNQGQVVGWAETRKEDETCNQTGQELGFLGAIWDTHEGDRIRKLLPLAGTKDTATAASAINDWGQAVGISGICDQAVGRLSARTVVLWQPGQSRPIDLGNFGSEVWNTPMAINNFGVVVGFANAEGTEGTAFNEVPFRWSKRHGLEQLGILKGHPNGQALGVNTWGRIVGVSRPADDSPNHAVIWSGDKAVDLNQLAPGYDGHLLFAGDVNDFGVITGQARNADGEDVAFRATPMWWPFEAAAPGQTP